ncbi:hypothetical protein [Alloactinosynnema sp. L-07]|nr:hypothetical protein [Alloactinosynnema sp. L-07]
MASVRSAAEAFESQARDWNARADAGIGPLLRSVVPWRQGGDA